MSKLESFIRRMLAQRDCLDFAAQEIEAMPGAVLELGLGNGRTYDHLKQIMPNRDIYVFDRKVRPFASCAPPENRIFRGEVLETLIRAYDVLGKAAVLAHYDIATTNTEKSSKLAERVSPLLHRLMYSGSLVVSSVSMPFSHWSAVPLPASVKPERYFIYRVDGLR